MSWCIILCDELMYFVETSNAATLLQPTSSVTGRHHETKFQLKPRYEINDKQHPNSGCICIIL